MFSILFVCTGNQHRSASAEAFVRLLTADTHVVVASVGTMGIEGAPAAPEAIAFCASVGADLSRHRSRPLAAGAARLADLVCGFELSHISSAVIDGGAALAKTFTLVEIVGLLERLGPALETELEARARERVARAHVLRAQQTGFVPGLEIADPIARSAREQERTLRQVWELCINLVDGLIDEV